MDLTVSPFNVTIMSNSRSVLKHLIPVTSTDVYEGMTKKLNDDGLFSTTIFGRPAEERRQNTFSYIDLRTKIMHPILYANIEKVNASYIAICNGTAYATWDQESGTFVESNALDGDTGFGFFMKRFNEIKFVKNDSERRSLYIDVLDKFRETGVYDFVLVAPAGLRDIEENEKEGSLSQDEMNEFYRNLISLSKNIDTTFTDNKFNDGSKLLMQRNFNSIYNLVFSYIDGKRGVTQDKYSKRKLENGTRSVLSSMDLAVEDMRGPQAISMLNTGIGLYQMSKAALPLIAFAFKHALITDTFIGNNEAYVISPKTMKIERREVSSKVRDLYITEGGANDFLNKFESISIRDKPLMIAGGYIALVYRYKDTFKIVKDPDTVPEGVPGTLTPITYGEFLYYLAKPHLENKPLWSTRFPYTNEDSTSPAIPYIKTTDKGTPLYEIDDMWVTKTDMVYNEWPTLNDTWVETLIIHPSRLAAKGADFDGDTGSGDVTYSDESVKEVSDYLNNIDSWFVDGRVRFLASTDTASWLLKSMST